MSASAPGGGGPHCVPPRMSSPPRVNVASFRASADRLEPAILERGRELLSGIEPEPLIAMTPAWWQERLMEWATADPDFRVKLLHFVDVLPSLRTNRAVADHVRQYFRTESSGAVRLGSAMGRRGLFRPILSRVVREGVFAMADRFIVGATPDEALPRLRDLVSEGIAYTIDLLGEATLSDAEADGYRDRYLDVLGTLRGAPEWEGPPSARRPNLSLKLSALTAHFEPAAPARTYESLRERLLSVARAARELGAFLNIDVEQYRYRDLTTDILARLLREEGLGDGPELGIVVQAYLRDSLAEVERLKAMARGRAVPLTIRLVKGAYFDEEVVIARQSGHPVPVFQEKAATDLNFERCSEALIAAYPDLRPAFATHNPRSIAQAMIRSERAGVAREDVEFQVLFGMAKGLRRAVAGMGYRTRVYVPAGEIIPGMGYLVRRLLENTSNESWLVQEHEAMTPEKALERPDPPQAPVPASAAAFRNHPPLEFYRGEVRGEMEAAIRRCRAGFGRSYPLVIDGSQDPGKTGSLEVRPPSEPSRVMGRVARAGDEEVDAAVSAGARAFPRWRDTPPRERARVLRRAAELVDEARFDLAATMAFESGKPWREADGDVTEAIDFLGFYADEAERLGEARDLTTVPGETNRLLLEGRGVVAVIGPWNFPLAIIGGMTGAALAAGNAVLLKPAEESPIIASRLASILGEAGVPTGTLHCLPGPGPETGRRLVEHPRVDMIAFTGGTETGFAIARAAAEVREGQRGPKKLIAELGGKNAIIVDEDADLDLAVEGVAHSAFGYAGQKCSAASRVIVVGSAYGAFRERLRHAVPSLPVGPPDDPFTVVPPVISRDARERIEGYIALGYAEGRILAKGRLPRGEGHYVAPYVFEDLPRSSRLAREEVFGPLLVVFRARCFEEALEIALDSEFALTGGLYSRNPRNIRRAGEAYRVGNLYLNRPITGAMVHRQPFGGFHRSGMGTKTGGAGYVREFMVARVITENTMRRGVVPTEESGAAWGFG